MTVTSKLPANAERNKEIEKIQEREEKAASFGGAVRGSVPEDELSGEGVRHSEAESEIPTPTPAINLRFNIDGLTKGRERVGGLLVGEVEEEPE